MGNANDAILSWENHIKMQMHVPKELQWRVPATGGGCQPLVEGASWLRGALVGIFLFVPLGSLCDLAVITPQPTYIFPGPRPHMGL